MTKVVAVVGVTGNQGGSVAKRFLQDARYHVRGLTRDPTSAKAEELAEQGVEVVRADLNDVENLKEAFAGASLIFTVTNYWEPFFRPDCRQKAAELGISCRRHAYDVEYQQGKNMADAAAATCGTLDDNGFIASTLSHAGNCSQGKFKELYHFDAKADVFPGYVRDNHPELAKKMSCVQTGYFMSSYKLAPNSYFVKQADGSFVMRFPTAPTKPVPHLAVNEDTGSFVYAVSQMPPGRSYMAEGWTCSWLDFMRIWSGVTGHKGRYEQVSDTDMIKAAQDQAFGAELNDMFLYSDNPGYDGGDDTLLTAPDIRRASIECPMTTLEQYMRTADWSTVTS
ncbi:hypothetical protein LTR36_010340 [Oleoguttula mirabilis]|uniref:NmrA-like domain-containing protein n=1 Tax=Oleoguttula mirabilis TaxID=1507867 RepID=A0AAV9J520_9PEZI|nr:hypothetical protein LTR36_010340 [Oleoguttula mirabilis]